MQTYKTLPDVIALAEFAHRNQTDKAGLPYIEHPRRVMESVQRQGAFPYVQMAAILHDVTEDTAFTCNMLRTLGVPEAAVEIVALLDRDHSKNAYDVEMALRINGQIDIPDYCKDADSYYYYHIRQNPGAKVVKLADIDDNTQQWRLSYLPEDTQNRLQIKYDNARRLLNSNF